MEKEEKRIKGEVEILKFNFLNIEKGYSRNSGSRFKLEYGRGFVYKCFASLYGGYLGAISVLYVHVQETSFNPLHPKQELLRHFLCTHLICQ